jgi:hypothetical protein
MFALAAFRFISKHWLPIVSAIALAFLAAAIYAAGYQRGSGKVRLEMTEQREQVAQAHRHAMEFAVQTARDLAKADGERRANYEAVLATERLEKERLRNALARSQMLTRPEPTDADPTPCARYSDAWRVCWNANWSSSAADRAACEAAGRSLLGAGSS